MCVYVTSDLDDPVGSSRHNARCNPSSLSATDDRVGRGIELLSRRLSDPTRDGKRGCHATGRRLTSESSLSRGSSGSWNGSERAWRSEDVLEQDSKSNALYWKRFSEEGVGGRVSCMLNASRWGGVAGGEGPSDSSCRVRGQPGPGPHGTGTPGWAWTDGRLPPSELRLISVISGWSG